MSDPIGYDPYSDAVMRDPFPLYARLRNEAPAYYLERYDTWFLSRFEDIWNATTRSDVFSAETGVSPGQVLLREGPTPQTFLTMDMPRHRTLRALISRPYMRKQVAALEPRVRELTRELLAPLVARGHFDVYRDLANPLATRIIGEIIGLETADALQLREWIEIFFRREPGQIGTSEEGGAAMGQLVARTQAIVEERMQGAADGDDHLSVWIRSEIDGERMAVPDICSHVFSMMVTGSEVVPLGVANTAVYLFEHLEQRARVVEDPAQIVPAFAESLRYDQPTNLLGRRLKADIELHGQKLRAGQGVMFLWASANRDEREFPDADRFDITRSPRRSLSYGHGIHKCIGEHLGNLEGRVLLEELLRAVPDYAIAGAERTYGEFLHGYSRVPIEFEPRALPDA